MAVGYGPRGGEFVHENEHAAAMDMEKVFFRLHSKLISSVTSFCTLGSLRLVEYMALANALVLLCVLLFLHANFVGAANSNNCVVKELQKRIGSMEEFDVVQVQVAGIWSHLANVDLDGAEAIQLAKVNGGVAARELVATWLTDPVFLYAKERGYLLLSPEARTKHGIRDLNISLSFDCVREKTPFVMFVLDNFVGYDTVMANTFIQAGNGEGYMYSRISRDFVDLNNISTGYGTDTRSSRNEYFAFKVGILVTTVFLFFISTTLVHHTLRETQQKMLEFTVELQRHIELGKPYHKLVLNHVANSVVFVPIMVGTLFFLFEFFNDQLLAFIVLALVWICELYSVITLRCKTSINTFPRLFFVYYASFHLYFFSFPTGFVYLALTTAIVFLHHGMLFFWGRFEIPAYLSGRISAQHPREVLFSGSVNDAQTHSLAYHAIVGEQGPVSNVETSRTIITKESTNENCIPQHQGQATDVCAPVVQAATQDVAVTSRRKKRQTLHSPPALNDDYARKRIEPGGDILPSGASPRQHRRFSPGFDST